MAWLSASPKPPARDGKTPSKHDPQTRLQRLMADAIHPDLPPNRAPWIIDRLMEIGPSEAGAMGTVPVSWTTIAHWQACMGIELAPWVTQLLRHLSVAFVAESQNAQDADCPAPWTQPNEDQRTVVSRKVSHAFRSLIYSKENAP